jgi:hypothetical protein
MNITPMTSENSDLQLAGNAQIMHDTSVAN